MNDKSKSQVGQPVTWENIIILAVALLSSGIIGTLLKSRKTSAEVDKTIVEQAKTLVDELQEERKVGREDREELRRELRHLQAEIKQLKAELKAQEVAIGNLTARAMKYQLALTITIRQLRLAGFEPMIEPSKIEAMEVEEMRTIAEGLSNVDQRRQKRERANDD